LFQHPGATKKKIVQFSTYAKVNCSGVLEGTILTVLQQDPGIFFFLEHMPKHASLYIRRSRREDGSIQGLAELQKKFREKKMKLYKANFVRPRYSKVLQHREV
jgi:hypothetical protein